MYRSLPVAFTGDRYFFMTSKGSRSQIFQLHLGLFSKVPLSAPSILAQYPDSPRKVFAGIKAVGFSEVMGVARGAEKTARYEVEKLKENLDQGYSFYDHFLLPFLCRNCQEACTGAYTHILIKCLWGFF